MATGAPEAQRLAEAIAPPPGRAAVMQSLSHRCPQTNSLWDQFTSLAQITSDKPK